MQNIVTALRINNLSKTYANGTQALRDISFNVNAGEFLGVLGPNGAGKSTLINIITSLTTKTAGTVTAFNHDLVRNNNEVKYCIGVVPQEFNLPAFRKIKSVLFSAAGFYGIPYHEARKRVEKYLRLFHLWDKRDDMCRTLSGGMKRRLMIARALLHEPKLLILDEPTAGVDIDLRRGTWQLLRELNQHGTTILLTTHYLEEAESLCERIIILDQGEIKEDLPTSKLLTKLSKEILILDCEQAIHNIPQHPLFRFQQLNETRLEVEFSRSSNLNELFAVLSAEHIMVKSLRNKANRLEELFLQLTNHNSSNSS